MKKLLLVVLILALLGCSKEIERINIVEGKLDKDYFTIKETKKIKFWADIDVSYVGDASLIYKIRVFKDESLEFNCEADALNVNVKMFSTRIQVNDKITIKYQGKLKCEFSPQKAGKYEIEVKQKFDGNFLKKNKYNLLIKQ